MIAVTGIWPFHAPRRLYSNSSGASWRLMFSSRQAGARGARRNQCRVADPDRRRRLVHTFQHFHTDQRILAAADRHRVRRGRSSSTLLLPAFRRKPESGSDSAGALDPGLRRDTLGGRRISSAQIELVLIGKFGKPVQIDLVEKLAPSPRRAPHPRRGSLPARRPCSS